MKHTVMRAVGIAAASVVGLGLAQVPPAAADDASADRAGGWAVRQLGDDDLLPSPFAGFPDQGLSIDLALSLQASDQRPAKVTAIRDGVAGAIDSYAAPYSYRENSQDPESDLLGATPSNATAKSLVLALQTDGDPNDFGGLDLETQLEDSVTQGRLSDNPTRNGEPDPAARDFANIIGQGFAVHALDELGSDEADDALTFLASQQCTDGSFRLDLVDATDVDAACAAEGGDVDATALALLQVAEVDDPAAGLVLADGAAWLRSVQASDGSFAGTGPTDNANANSTGLAGLALAEAGATSRAARAARWVADLQLVNSRRCNAFDRADAGAIAYTPRALTRAARQGITDDKADQFRRTTAQVLPILELAPAATATGPCR